MPWRLWRPSVAQGTIQVGAKPLVGRTEASSSPGQQIKRAANQTIGDEWQLVSDYVPPLRSNVKPEATFAFLETAPLKFVTGQKQLARIVGWLHNESRLTESHLPIVSIQPSRFVLSTEPKDPSGKTIRKHTKVGSMYFDREFQRQPAHPERETHHSRVPGLIQQISR